MRRDELYLNDIIEAARYVAEFVRETAVEAFRKSELVRSAVVQKLTIIGEAAALISGDFERWTSGNSLAANCRLPEYSDSRVFRD